MAAKAKKKKSTAAAKTTSTKEEDALLVEAREVILPKLQEGTTTVGAERDRLGHNNNRKIRDALIEVLGSRDAYFELIHQRRRATAQQIQDGSLPTVAVFSDKDVPKISSTKRADGWRSTTITVGGTRQDLFFSPDGIEYVKARADEKADLLVDTPTKELELGIIRLRFFKTSNKAKQIKKEKKLVDHGNGAKEAKKNGKKKSVRRKL